MNFSTSPIASTSIDSKLAIDVPQLHAPVLVLIALIPKLRVVDGSITTSQASRRIAARATRPPTAAVQETTSMHNDISTNRELHQ
jgi:hypothetical protein